MKVTLLHDGTYASNCYLVEDDAMTEAVVIDPSVPPARAVDVLGRMPRVTAILLTHGHFDHMLALSAWREATGAPLLMSREDAPALSDSRLSCARLFLGEEMRFPPPERLLAAGDTVAIGEETLSVLLAPGHTPGGLLFDSGEYLFTGDTLFGEGGYGRFDLPGGDRDTLASTLARILRMEGERRVLSGHGGEGCLSHLKQYFSFS